MKKLFGLFLIFVLICGTVSVVFAADADAYNSANILYDLGLFSGTGTDVEGNPNFDLDRSPTRHEAVTMLVSLLGKKEEAMTGTWDTPFTDVANWAKPFVGYAYANGLTSGTSATTFGGNDPITATQYLTFVLKVLGYEVGTDFQWNRAWELSDRIGMTDGRYREPNQVFLRGDVTLISRNALDQSHKDDEQTLSEKLMSENLFTAEDYKKTVESPLVIREQDPWEGHVVDVMFSINGKMQDYVGDYIAKAGTYTLIPYFRGERLYEYEIDYDKGYEPDNTGKVKKNSDGTLTVVYPGKEDFAFTIVYVTNREEVVDENGEIRYLESHTKRSLGFAAYPDKGLAMKSGHNTFMPGKSFGDKFSPYFVMEDILYNGKRIIDYTVTVQDGAPFTVKIQADGSLLIMRTGHGTGNFTITHNGMSASYEVKL